MPFNPNIKNTSMPVVKNTAKKKTPPKRPVGKQTFSAPTDDRVTQLNAMDPAERYKQVLSMMGNQLGSRQGNTGLRFNQGQQDWLQSLSLPDLLNELGGAFNRQRPHFGNPVAQGGVPSPVGPQVANEQPQPMPGGGNIRNTSMGSSVSGQSGKPDLVQALSQLRNMTGGGGNQSLNGGGFMAPGGNTLYKTGDPNNPMRTGLQLPWDGMNRAAGAGGSGAPQVQPTANQMPPSLMPYLGGMGVAGYGPAPLGNIGYQPALNLGEPPSGSSYGPSVPSLSFGGGVPSPINGGGYLGGGNPFLGGGMQNMNGGGYQAPGQNPNIMNILSMLRGRPPQGNY